MTVRAAVVGAGLMGRWHAHALVRAGGSVAAVVDPDSGAADRLAAAHGSPPRFQSLTEALEAGQLDVVHVCTPTESHSALVLESLAGGADVLVEKPLATDLDATEELVEHARTAGRLLCPVHQYLYQPGFRQLERSAASLGPWRHIEATMCSAGAEGRPAEADAIAAEILPHPLASLERALPGGLAGLGWSAARLAGGELRASGTAGETTVSICVSMGGRPTRNELRLIGSQGTIELDHFHGYAFVERGRPSRAGKALRPFSLSGRRAAAAAVNLSGRARRKEPAYPGLRSLIESFYEAARTRGEPPISFEETLAVATARAELVALSAS